MQRQIFLIVSLDGQLCLKKESALVQPQKSKEEKKNTHTNTKNKRVVWHDAASCFRWCSARDDEIVLPVSKVSSECCLFCSPFNQLIICVVVELICCFCCWKDTTPVLATTMMRKMTINAVGAVEHNGDNHFVGERSHHRHCRMMMML